MLKELVRSLFEVTTTRNGLFLINVEKKSNGRCKAVVTGILVGLPKKSMSTPMKTPLLEETELGPYEFEGDTETEVLELSKAVIEEKGGPIISIKKHSK